MNLLAPRMNSAWPGGASRQWQTPPPEELPFSRALTASLPVLVVLLVREKYFMPLEHTTMMNWDSWIFWMTHSLCPSTAEAEVFPQSPEPPGKRTGNLTHLYSLEVEVTRWAMLQDGLIICPKSLLCTGSRHGPTPRNS